MKKSKNILEEYGNSLQSHFERMQKEVSARFESLVLEAVNQKEKDLGLLGRSLEGSRRTLEVIKAEYQQGFDLAQKQYLEAKDLNKKIKLIPYEDFYKQLRRKKQELVILKENNSGQKKIEELLKLITIPVVDARFGEGLVKSAISPE